MNEQPIHETLLGQKQLPAIGTHDRAHEQRQKRKQQQKLLPSRLLQARDAICERISEQQTPRGYLERNAERISNQFPIIWVRQKSPVCAPVPAANQFAIVVYVETVSSEYQQPAEIHDAHQQQRRQKQKQLGRPFAIAGRVYIDDLVGNPAHDAAPVPESASRRASSGSKPSWTDSPGEYRVPPR
ncbi:hypothetical protein D3C76_1151810 [compost metagenome]